MPDPAWAPNTANVAILIPARAYSRGGQQPDFDDTTTPTATFVTDLISDSVQTIQGEVEENMPEAVQPLAARVTALLTAKNIERGSRDYNADRFRDLRVDYESELAKLVKAVEDIAAGEDPGVGDDRAVPIGVFPPAPCDDDVLPGCERPYRDCY